MKRLFLEKTTLRIFICILLAGIIGVGGISFLSYEINCFSSNYRQMIAENYENKEYMEQISKLLYQHQAIVSNHIRSAEQEEKRQLEETEMSVRTEIREVLSEFEKRMRYEEEEQLYHNVYSNVYSYLKNVDVVFELSRSGDNLTANYYVSSVMAEFVENVNHSIAAMEGLTDAKLGKAKVTMDDTIMAARVSAGICTGCILVAMLVCIWFCVRMTSRLEQYKRSLEIEVDQTKQELLDHDAKIMEIQENTVIGMANLIENRDGETGGHVKRTSAYVELLARAAQREGSYPDVLTNDYLELLVKAAPMHDVGKVVVPDHILKKPGKLTEEEFDVMKLHAQEGGRIVREVLAGVEEKEYIEIASDVASYHHEKWNGQGYPCHKKGEEIPLCARIMAVADVFDALVSERCYKKALTLEEAMKIIEEEAGEQFDPVLAKLFVRHRKEVKRIMEEV